ncbi:MAG: DUF2309 domain-containing protein [Blastochloris sp.]|nr:DUF2309 domain-containing protein [Blastochloris sp.]
MKTINSPQAPAIYSAEILSAATRVAPLWPLKHFVAVNPFFSLSSNHFIDVCSLIKRIHHGEMLMAADFFISKWNNHQIKESDLLWALQETVRDLPAASQESLAHINVGKLITWLKQTEAPQTNPPTTPIEVKTIAEIVDANNKTSWSSAILDEVSKWCAAYYDEGISAWSMPKKDRDFYQAWRSVAAQDPSLEILGLTNFRTFVAALPEEADQAITELTKKLNLAPDALEDFYHRQWATLPGWSSSVQYRVREHALRGQSDHALLHLLAVRLAYDVAILERYDAVELRTLWAKQFTNKPESSTARLMAYIWHLAMEHAYQRTLTSNLLQSASAPKTFTAQPLTAQAIFCIDVRSEVIRRNIESSSPKIETLGFAGFFGLAIEYVPMGANEGSCQCPVLLLPQHKIREGLLNAKPEDEATVLRTLHLGKKISHAWNAFSSSAISCFSFVETAGLLYGWSLLRDSLGFTRPTLPSRPDNTRGPRITCQPAFKATAKTSGQPMSLETQIASAQGILKNLGLTTGFARLVLFCGHGSSTVNNPYGSGLDCGACGGNTGDSNARVASSILNNPEVRRGLEKEGIFLPKETWFLAGLHNTTTDDIVLFELNSVPAEFTQDVQDLQKSLAQASVLTRRERSQSLGLGDAQEDKLDKLVRSRSQDWAQVRPEWGLAGNAAFIAAPRARTRELNLGGRTFLHNYEHIHDTTKSTLELIMTAPMVVANWINMQYYASTVNNNVFGSGNKVLHNVVGIFGVCQGNGGDLLTGLPLQSVHDGEKWMHEPLRLSVYLEAPREAIDQVLNKHEQVRDLVEKSWLHLFCIEEEGKKISRCLQTGCWELQQPHALT